MTEIRAEGHLHVEPSIYLAGLPYFHDDIRQDFFIIIQDPLLKRSRHRKPLIQQARVRDKGFQKRPIIFGHSVWWLQTWDISQNHGTILIGSAPAPHPLYPPAKSRVKELVQDLVPSSFGNLFSRS